MKFVYDMENRKINIKAYFGKGTFVVPDYQRGYKWAVKDNEKSSLEYFMTSLIDAFNNSLNEYFIEAVTVVVDEEKDEITLVDGQQRTTSLFLLFAVLDEKEFLNGKMLYAVREDSHNWLNNLVVDEKVLIADDDVQDIYYFKEANEYIKGRIEYEKEARKKKEEVFNPNDFSNFIKEKVYLLYNQIPKQKAVNTFIALNGLKAIMKDEELIKSDLLIKSSRIEKQENRDQKEQFGIEWKINEDRGRLARNWDKWLYWWNQKEVREYFGILKADHPLYYLLVTYWNITPREEKQAKEFSFYNFKKQFINSAKNAKLSFEKLRKLQKTFEDLYNDWESYNLLGLALKSSIEKKDVLEFFIQNREKKDILDRFVKWSLVGCDLKKIKTNDEDNFIENKHRLKSSLEDEDLYEAKGKNDAYLQLLRMNVQDMKNRKFDFEIFKTKSLEHICPQSPHESDTDLIRSQKEINEKSDGANSIGNLVLLNGSTNSKLSNKPLSLKKQLLFDKIKEGFLLPHTLKVFSKSFKTNGTKNETEKLFDNEKFWTAQNVKDNKDYFINEFDLYYGK